VALLIYEHEWWMARHDKKLMDRGKINEWRHTGWNGFMNTTNEWKKLNEQWMNGNYGSINGNLKF
jgi:hypothetical protein